MESPLLPLPPDELGPLLLVHLERVVRDVGLRDDPQHLHPVGEHLLGDQVQGQHVLRQGEVDLQDLLLDADRVLALVIDQLCDNSISRMKQFYALLAKLIETHS